MWEFKLEEHLTSLFTFFGLSSGNLRVVSTLPRPLLREFSPPPLSLLSPLCLSQRSSFIDLEWERFLAKESECRMLHRPLSVCRKQPWYLRIDCPSLLLVSPLASTHKADINYNCSPQRVVESPQKPNCFLKAPFLLRLISDLATFSILIGSPRWCPADCQTTRLPYNAPPHTQTHRNIYTLILSSVSAQFGASSSSSCPAWGSFVVALIKLH